jgi:hypothetical protein
MKYFDQTRRLLAALMLSAIPLFAQIDTSSFTTQTNSFITRRDSQIFRLWALSFLQKAHYDPGKAAR